MIETFNKFNNGMRRPDRNRHMVLCGFELNSYVLMQDANDGFKPRDRAKDLIRMGYSHVVYFVGGKDYDGYPIYYYYTK